MTNTSSLPQTIADLQQRVAREHGSARAIEGVGAAPLDHAGLWAELERIRDALRAAQVGREDRVAVILPNGPEMAVAFLGVSAVATCAPLNPSYRKAELEFYLGDLDVAALLIADGVNEAAIEVATAKQIPILRVVRATARGAGCFDLVSGPQPPRPHRSGAAEPDDIALILHTSGTTSRPKMVPLSQRNLCASARNIVAALALGPDDFCLNVMPLFHIHGLMAATLASVTAGAGVFCSPGISAGFGADAFFETLRSRRATWYTAVPTIHQAVLAHAQAHAEVTSELSLRFVRSSSASLPPTVMRQLEATFRVPVLEAYGMTEASHQMASNPLPPGARKPSSVGVAAGPRIAIMDATGTLLPAGARGEVVIRGTNVTQGYLANAEANAKAFTDGWFRTGDEGYLDEQTYLFLTGRLKEQINRAGEKISPLEIDELLLQHPAVAQAVTFALPHETLGEVVAAAVVARAPVKEEELRAFLTERLADYKVPQRVLLVDEIPKGATGKVQRIGLAEKLAARLRPDFVAPSSPRERQLARLWASALNLRDVSAQDNFFFVGGDSLRIMTIIEAAAREGLTLEIERFATHPTLAEMAKSLDAGVPTDQASFPNGRFVELRPGARDRTVYLFPPASGSAINYATLARRIGGTVRVLGFESPELYGPRGVYRDLMDMARRCAELVVADQPSGEITLGGYSIGAALAFEVAHVLMAAGRQVRCLVMVDPEPLTSAAKLAEREREQACVRTLLRAWSDPPAELVEAVARYKARTITQRVSAALSATDLAAIETDVDLLLDVWDFARMERIDRSRLASRGAHDVIRHIFAGGDQPGAQPLGELVGAAVRRISKEPLTAFRVVRTQFRNVEMYARYTPTPTLGAPVVLIHRAVNSVDAWQPLITSPVEHHSLAITDHLEFVENADALALIARVLETRLGP
jgi:acyl-CoA synthetase (AMP-forming)/AMP-acid ligase II/thioesterase domain-containing protein/aryl carrier-like protein